MHAFTRVLCSAQRACVCSGVHMSMRACLHTCPHGLCSPPPTRACMCSGVHMTACMHAHVCCAPLLTHAHACACAQVRVQHEQFAEGARHASRQILLISELEVRDRLASSRINKFLYRYTSEAMPRQSHANMVRAPDNPDPNPNP